MSRSSWKNNYISTPLWHFMLFRKTYGLKKKDLVSSLALRSVSTKSSSILPIMEGKTFWIHNGLKYKPVLVKAFMFGNKFGEYIQTKVRCVFRRKKRGKTLKSKSKNK